MSLISSEFRVSLFDGYPFNFESINLPEVYRGHVLGYPNSSVLVQIDNNNQLSATIDFMDSIVILEVGFSAFFSIPTCKQALSFFDGYRDSNKMLVYWFHDIITQNM